MTNRELKKKTHKIINMDNGTTYYRVEVFIKLFGLWFEIAHWEDEDLEIADASATQFIDYMKLDPRGDV